MSFIIQSSTIQLLRLKFSFFLMPIYWFALSQINRIDPSKAILVFIILHFLIYPASNGYNSYMDKDTASIGGVEHPLPASRQLYYATIILDIAGLIAGLFVSVYFTILLLCYILASKSYSYRGIRLKKFPLISYFIAIVFQGAVVYAMVYNSCGISVTNYLPPLPAIASSLFVGSFYPLTQIYQHKQDKASNIKTISIMLGYSSTFLFAFITGFLGLLVTAFYFGAKQELDRFLVILICMLPSIIFLIVWYMIVCKNKDAASFNNSMKMNWIAAVGSNLAFIIILIIKNKF